MSGDNKGKPHSPHKLRACDPPHILVLDDNRVTAGNLQCMLAEHFSCGDEFVIQSFTSGKDLVNWVERNKRRVSIALVLADYHLGETLTGLDVLRKIVSIFPLTKLALFSGRARASDYVRVINEKLLDACFLKEEQKLERDAIGKIRTLLDEWNDERRKRRGTCFVVMPFGKGFDNVYRSLFKPAIESLGYLCVRQDERKTVNKHILDDVIENIHRASLVICDITTRNPNVFYELGIAHCLNKPVLILTQSMRNLPFDVRFFRISRYNPRWKSFSAIRQEIQALIVKE